MGTLGDEVRLTSEETAESDERYRPSRDGDAESERVAGGSERVAEEAGTGVDGARMARGLGLMASSCRDTSSCQSFCCGGKARGATGSGGRGRGVC